MYASKTLLVAGGVALFGLVGTSAAADNQTSRIRIEYVVPKNPQHQYIYDMLKQRKALEKLQEIFSPLRLPAEVTLRTVGCDGICNAWYEQGVISVCYEHLEHIKKMMPKQVTEAGLTPDDAISGQFFYAGHGARSDVLTVAERCRRQGIAFTLARRRPRRLPGRGVASIPSRHRKFPSTGLLCRHGYTEFLRIARLSAGSYAAPVHEDRSETKSTRP